MVVLHVYIYFTYISEYALDFLSKILSILNFCPRILDDGIWIYATESRKFSSLSLSTSQRLSTWTSLVQMTSVLPVNHLVPLWPI